MPRSYNVPKYDWLPIGLTVGSIAAGLILLGSTGGNEHGSSKTNINTEPSYAVDPLEPVVTPEPAPLPEKAPLTDMRVCDRVVFDEEHGIAYVRPAVRTATSGRPLFPQVIDSEGASFADPLPVNNLEIRNMDGSDDSDQQLNGCAPESVEVRQVLFEGVSRYVLVRTLSDVREGQPLPDDPIAAVCSGQVSAAFPMTGEEMKALEVQLANPGC